MSRRARLNPLLLPMLAAFALILGALWFSAALAVAGEAHVFSFGFASPGAEAGQVSSPAGVAVDPLTHDVYVADQGNHRVDEFEAGGAFVRAWGWGVVVGGLGGFEVCGPEAIPSSACQEGSSGMEPGQFESPTFIALDTSAGPSAGDVYVGDAGDNVVTKFTAAGGLVESWGVKGQLSGESATSPPGGVAGPFGALAGVAVDAGGDLWVYDQSSSMFEFSQVGVFTTDWSSGRGVIPGGIGVDSSGSLYVGTGEPGVGKFSAFGTLIGNLENQLAPTGIAVDGSTNDLYVDGGSSVAHYSASCEPALGFCSPIDSFGAGVLSAGGGLGLDSSNEAVYVSDAGTDRVDVFTAGVLTGRSSKRTASAAVLNGTVDPQGQQLSECRFEYVTKAAFEASGYTDLGSGGEAPCVPAAASIPADSGEHSVSAEVGGLKGGETYEFRLTAGSVKAGTLYGNSEILTTATPPEVLPGSAVALNVSASSVDLEAEIDPRDGDTTYRFEYGESTVYSASVPIPAAGIGEGERPVRVAQHVTGLSPGITYHWRVVASNPAGTSVGADHTFVYDESGPGLPDGRAYEMVTPAQKNGTLIGNYGLAFPPQVAADGSRVILGAVQCFGGARSCTVTRQSIGTLYAFTRGGGGWSATALAPPATEVETSTYDGASAETGGALFSGPTPPGGEDDFYARQPGGSFVDLGPLSPPSAGADLTDVQSVKAATNAGFSHVVFDSEPVWPFTVSEPQRGSSLLEYNLAGGGAAREPELVGVSGGLGSSEEISACSTVLAASPPDESLSADGRTVYFTAGACGSGTGAVDGEHPVPVQELYARVDGGEPGARTVAISEPGAPQIAPEEPGACTSALCLREACASVACVENTSPSDEGDWRAAEFEGTSNDGSKVLFTSAQQLTDTATEDATEAGCRDFAAGENGCNLYLYDFDLPAGHRLIDVSAAEGGATVPGGPRVQGVLALSGDGSHAYFVAKGVLSTQPRPGCTAEFNRAGVTGAAGEERCKAREGENNVYVYERDTEYPEGHLSFVATLQEELPNGDQLVIGLGQPANVTPDGRFLVFTAADDLTADDTRPDTRSGGAEQVFRYDAGSERLTRISIGERGFDDDGNAGAGNAYIVPGSRGYVSPGVESPGEERRLDPTMSDDGSRVFFMSPVALTAGALESVVIGQNLFHETAYAENVYEWEQPGVGSCPSGQSEGCVFLLSDGRDTNTAPAGEACYPNISAVCLIGSDATGQNAFFSTADPLVAADIDTELDFYDARICEPENGNPCIQPAATTTPCLGEACHGTPPATPSLLAPGTASFNGAGNLVPPPAVKPKSLTRAQKLVAALKICKKDKKKTKRVACEKQAKKKYGPVKQKKAKKAGNKRRAGR
jgi:sugar lactone lactonase YvrE